MPLKWFVFWAASIVLPGCAAYGIKDLSHDPSVQALIGQCYQLTGESFVYEARCVDLNSKGVGSRELCPGLHSFSAGTEMSVFPGSYEEYTGDKEKWDKKMFEKLLFEKQREISYPVPKGTKFYITSVVGYPWGVTGHKLAMRADLEGPNGTEEVELRTIGILTYGQIWARRDRMNNISFNSEFAIPCD